MTILYLIFGILVAVGFIFYLKYFIPLRPAEPGFEYVYVNEDGTVSELNEEDVEYLKAEFSPSDGARPYIKSFYKQLTPDKKISGFILRKRVPKRIEIQPYKDPNEKRIIAWIFLAVSMASETEPADLIGISTIADGINHAVPTQRELQTSISWLTAKGLIIKQGKSYDLTSKGKIEYESASKNIQTVMKIWENIELNFNDYGDN